MTFLLLLIVLGILVFVHELGHFLVAKKCGIRVDEFGLGFPPRIWSFRKGETLYSLNLIPFGGFVKIFGENPDDESLIGPESARSFAKKNRGIQAAVLAAGISFNIIFAWFIISIGYAVGLPTPVGSFGSVEVLNPKLTIIDVSKDSPAAIAGLLPGDTVAAIADVTGESLDTLSPESVSQFIGSRGEQPLAITYERGSSSKTVTVIPQTGVVEGRSAIGIGMDLIGTVRFPLYRALWEGAKTTYSLIISIAAGLGGFLYHALTFTANFSEVTGPVGIAGLVGSAAALGFVHLLMITAFISLNLAVINILPFPALDGGRLLFVLIEMITRKSIKPKFMNAVNAAGFVLLLILMVIVTAHDIIKIW